MSIHSRPPPRANPRRRYERNARISLTSLCLVSCVFQMFLHATPSSAFPPVQVHHTSQKNSNSLPATFARPSNQEGKSVPKKRNPGKPKKKSKRTKPRKNLKDGPRPRRTLSARPILTHYDANTSPAINNNRLRDAINCEHFESCSGCLVNDMVGDISKIQSARAYFSSPWIRQKIARHSANNGDFFRVVVPSPITAWRSQAKLVAAPKSSTWAKDGCMFGLYRQRTHEVVTIPNCEVHHPSINRAVEVLQEATRKVGTAAYQEDTREGDLRYIQCQVERTTGKVCLTLIWNAKGLKDAQPALSRLLKELNKLDPKLWHSIWVNCNDSEGNNIIARNPNRWHRM